MASSLQEYLKRYSSDPHQSDESKKKKRKKKKKEIKPSLTLVDDDPLWQKEIKEASSSEEDEQDDAPLVIKDVEVKRMQKLEALKMQRPYISIAGDGSGWVTLTDVPKQNTLEKEYSRQNRHDTPESLSPARKSADVSPVRMMQDDDQDISPGKSQYNGVDLSPPRRKQVLQRDTFSRESPSPTRKVRDSDPDLSPPRKRKGRHDSLDSYPTRREHDTVDLSPSKSKKIKQMSPDLSPPRRRKDRHDSPDSSLRHDSTKHAPQMQMLPRKRQQDSPDLSPVRKVRHDRPDLSPPRRSNLHTVERTSRKDQPKASEVSPVRRRRYDSLDLSPPRKRRSPPQRKAAPEKSRHDGTPDLSPERKGHHDFMPPSDLSPPRKRHSPQRKTVQRKSRHDSPDLFPKRKAHPDSTPPKESEHEDKESQMEKRKSRTVAGLQHGKHVAKEVELKKQEDTRRIAKLDTSKSGQHAATVYRDKLGKRVELDDLVKQQQADKPPKEKPLEWGKGLAQKREAEARMAELEAERLKPFARTRDDPDLDKHLRERLRWGDPMAHLVKKKTPEPVLEDFGEMKQMKDSGFIVPQDIPKHSWLKLGITPPPNRYGIKPGRHWDGVDRSNGFEKEMYKRQNEKKADQIEAYLWSVADM